MVFRSSLGCIMKLLISLQRHEIELLQWLQEQLHGVTFSLAKILSKSADGLPYILLTLIIAWLNPMANDDWVLAVATAFMIERYLYFICKNNFRRNRPPAVIAGFTSLIIPSDQFSLPSGHTSGAFLFATLLLPIFPVLAPLLFLWAISVGASRVILGVHFPTDTAIGALLGATVAWLINGVLL